MAMLSSCWDTSPRIRRGLMPGSSRATSTRDKRTTRPNPSEEHISAENPRNIQEKGGSHLGSSGLWCGNTNSTGRRNVLLPLKRTHWKNIEKYSNLLASPSNACTSLQSQPSPFLPQPILDGKSDKTLQQWANTDHRSRQNPGSHPRTPIARDRSATSENLQLNASNSTRDSDHRSILKEKDHMEK